MPLTSSSAILKEAVAARRVIVGFNAFSAESTAVAPGRRRSVARL